MRLSAPTAILRPGPALALAALALSAGFPAQAGTVPATLDFAVFRGDDAIGRLLDPFVRY